MNPLSAVLRHKRESTRELTCSELTSTAIPFQGTGISPQNPALLPSDQYGVKKIATEFFPRHFPGSHPSSRFFEAVKKLNGKRRESSGITAWNLGTKVLGKWNSVPRCIKW